MNKLDYLVTVTVDKKARHRFIIRSLSANEAEHVAISLVYDLAELDNEEIQKAEYTIAQFYELDYDGFFVCF